jgi:hypothetical protein
VDFDFRLIWRSSFFQQHPAAAPCPSNQQLVLALSVDGTCKVPTALSKVRFLGQPGRHLLALSFSQFDPSAT